MIKSFKDSDTAKIFDKQTVKKFPRELYPRALKKLYQIDHAKSLADLSVPYSNHLEPLQKDRKGQHSIRLNEQFRICFRWKETDVYDVEITDYH